MQECLAAHTSPGTYPAYTNIYRVASGNIRIAVRNEEGVYAAIELSPKDWDDLQEQLLRNGGR